MHRIFGHRDQGPEQVLHDVLYHLWVPPKLRGAPMGLWTLRSPSSHIRICHPTHPYLLSSPALRNHPRRHRCHPGRCHVHCRRWDTATTHSPLRHSPPRTHRCRWCSTPCPSSHGGSGAGSSPPRRSPPRRHTLHPRRARGHRSRRGSGAGSSPHRHSRCRRRTGPPGRRHGWSSPWGSGALSSCCQPSPRCRHSGMTPG